MTAGHFNHQTWGKDTRLWHFTAEKIQKISLSLSFARSMYLSTLSPITGNQSNLATVLLVPYWCYLTGITTALLCTDPLWPANTRDTLMSKGIFCFSWAYDPHNNSLRDQLFRKREGLLDGSLPKSKNCQGWNICFGPNKKVSRKGRKWINPLANPFVYIWSGLKLI